VGAGDAAGDGQAQAGAAGVTGAGLVQPDEAIEDAFVLVGGDAWAVIGHLDGRPGADASDLHDHGAVCSRGPHGVVHQVGEHLGEPLAVPGTVVGTPSTRTVRPGAVSLARSAAWTAISRRSTGDI